MNCYTHHEVSAVSKCQKCGRGLCPECTDKYAYPTCDKCTETKKKVEKIRKKITKSSIIFELILTFLVGFIAKFLFKGKAEEMTSQGNGAILHELTLWIPFFIAAGFVSILYMYSEYIRNKPPKNHVKVTVKVYSDSSTGCVGSVVKYFVLFFIGGSVGPYVFPIRTIFNVYRLLK